MCDVWREVLRIGYRIDVEKNERNGIAVEVENPLTCVW